MGYALAYTGFTGLAYGGIGLVLVTGGMLTRMAARRKK